MANICRHLLAERAQKASVIVIDLRRVILFSDYCLSFVPLDSRPGDPLHPEEYQQEPRREGLAMVEGLHHGAATH